MALKLSFPFPIFAPSPAPSITPSPNQTHHRALTEIRFARWNNANAEKFNERKRAIKEIEDEIRSRRRFESATKISAGADTNAASASTNNETFRSTGTRSAPSRPSIPGKKSKYSKNPNPPNPNPEPNFASHPAFQPQKPPAKLPEETPVNRKARVSMSESGVSYVVDGAPFEFKYSYTETPKVKPLKLREAPFAPFGPTTMPRPWTGQKPLPPSKKKPVEFDSFKLPPPHKKGIKPVQKPGPFLHGSGPKHVRSREEILGEPLTKMEIREMVKNNMQSRRLLHMGRDGLTHNMLDNVHALWKRRRICKIKCIGVCTVDMENVCQQLEEKTGGKVIHRAGGVLYLFRGRNYNYKTRPRYPLMLWKPVTPVYPRLIKQVPEGLTLEEATEMRKKGQDLIPICKLAKNGAYYDLVKNVREAFEACELIRINCQGLNGSDYRKIGAKLQDLVPCVLISFAEQHILMWRGRNWKSSLPEPIVDLKEANNSNFDDMASVSPPLEAEEVTASHISTVSVKNASSESLSASMYGMNLRDVSSVGTEDPSSTENAKPCTAIDAISIVGKTFQSETISDETLCNNGQSKAVTNTYESATKLANTGCAGEDSEAVSNTGVYESILDHKGCAGDEPTATLAEADTSDRVRSSSDLLESCVAGPMNRDNVPDISEATQDLKSGKSSTACTEGILQLLRQAVDGGSAIVLDDANLDADLIYQRAVAFAQVAPPGPAFRRDRPRKVKVAAQESEKQETGDAEAKEVIAASQEKRGSEKKKSSKSQRKKDFDVDDRYLDVVTHGSLRVDELAKLLA